MENTALKNNLAEDLEVSEYIDEYDDSEISEGLMADFDLAFEQIRRGEGSPVDEVLERLSKRYGNKI